VTAVEVIEHLDTACLAAFGRVVFGYLQPALVILTTPNFEYNVRWNAVPALRRKDHHFEWTRSQFQEWVSNFVRRHQYMFALSRWAVSLLKTMIFCAGDN
jgi:hypothetical protein